MKKLIMGFMLMPLMALATTWYVDGTNGSDGYSGKSPSTAKETIQAAIDAAVDGDTVFVAAGTYSSIRTDNKLLSVVGVEGANRTFIDGGQATRCVTVRPDNPPPGIYTNTLVCGFTLFRGRAITDDKNNANGGAIRGGVAERCVIMGNEARGGGAACESVLRNCLLCDNNALYNGGAGDGAVFINCTITGNSANDNGGACVSSVLLNCIVYGNDGITEEFDGRWLGWSNPLIELWPEWRVNVCDQDPLFVDAAKGDYRLAAKSPCIDVGNNSYVSSDADLDGLDRIANGMVDIGCYEYGSSGGPFVEKVGEVNWTYIIKNGKASVGDGVSAAISNGVADSVVVPTKLRERPVVAIDNKAFVDCTNMTSVTIPASVKTIGDSAFEGCGSLADVYFEGNTMSAIGKNVFSGCCWDLIMHVPVEWQGRGRTLCGYSVWKAGSLDEEKSVNITVTNVIVQYVLNSVQPDIAVPVSGETGFVAVITEVKSAGAVNVPNEWINNYPKFKTIYGNDFGKALMMKNGKKDGAGNEMFVWQDYVAGTDPTNPDDKFTASITLVEGVPVISFTPELSDKQKALRTYKTFGKKQLKDVDWDDLTGSDGDTMKDYNFYKVTVQMK